MKKYKIIIKTKGLKMNWVASQLCISGALLSMYLNEKRDMPFLIESKLKEILR